MPKINVGTADLNLLRVFLAIWDSHSLTLAGDRLGLTQPAVSHCLRRLRELFDDPLFVRTPEGMLPTAAAVRLQGPIDQALGIIGAALQQHSGFDPGTAIRTFRVSMSDMSEFYFLPPLLDALKTTAPSVRFDIVPTAVHALETALRSGDIDLALGYVPGLSGDCAAHTLFQDRHVCMVRAGHPHPGDELTIDDVRRLQYLSANSDATGHRMIEQWLFELAINRDIVLRLPHFTVVPEILRHTDLAAILPHSVAQAFNGESRYRLIELPFELPVIDVQLHWHRRFDNDAGLTWLRRVLVELFERPDEAAASKHRGNAPASGA